ncbi:GWxTD domain-containing protein [Roseivirga sp. E12]|uniref:GWxTD domain-containing protein n=1 Tax=Roseivirga sp. E12 TaxID=2819237 RepID=UPI001ABD2E71|nr:GWxTD domain-containing protein [Roseivirga sp. E12]MBO3699139.1 GWxTD domain-containing protein [Roseivirga sp. E12]
MGLVAQNRMSSADISYLYNQEHEFLVQHRVASNDDQVKVYLRFILNSGNVKISDYRISYDIRASYIDEKTINSSVVLDTTNVIDVAFRQYVYSFEIDKEPNDNLIVIDFYNSVRDKHFSLDIPLKIKEWTPSPHLIFQAGKELPYFDKYINKNFPIRIVNVFDGSDSFEINGVNSNKHVAMPPFDDSEMQVASNIPLDTVYGVTNGEEFRFYNNGFHAIRSSSNPEKELGIIVTDEVHPYFDDYRDMIDPLIYVSTNDEFKGMQAAEDSREAFEGFVSNTISSNEQIGKDFIKYYYRRVRKSARLFSENQAGWKTDRGMIYQVFGNPSQVFRNESTEMWTYPSSTGGRLKYIFDIVVEDGISKYKLIRANRYRENWMRAVTQWRSGRIIE